MDWEKDDLGEPASWRAFFGGLRILWGMTGSEKRRLVKAFVAQAILVFLAVISSFTLARFVDAVSRPVISSLSMALVPLVIFTALQVVHVAVDQYLAADWFWLAVNNLSRAWPMECQSKLLSLPLEFHEQNGTSKHIQKITRGCEHMTDLLVELFYNFMPAVVFWTINFLMLSWISGWISFALTIAFNIAYADPDATTAEIERAARAAHLGNVLDDRERFPHGLRTMVGERGVRLSGGEGQRVAFARAYLRLLRGAKVLVLDEATSSVDSEAEHAIREMVDAARQELGVSVIAIAHRLASVRTANRIYVLKDGRVVDMGDHMDLMGRSSPYADMVRLQNLAN